MQLLDYLFESQELDPGVAQTCKVLQDIVHNIQIESTCCIYHPHYGRVELQAEMAERFRQLPTEVQNRYLCLKLQSFLYRIYYNGTRKARSESEVSLDSLSSQSILENNTDGGPRSAFYQQLHQANAGDGYFDIGWLVIKEDPGRLVSVQKHDLTLCIERDYHLQPSQQAAEIGEMVAIHLPRNLVEQGFYIAVGNAGTPPSITDAISSSDRQLLSLSFNLVPEGAIALMRTLTQQLNLLGLPFTFKVAYDPSDYDRYDAGLLTIETSSYVAIQNILQAAYKDHQAQFKAEVPLFRKPLAPGLALAEEPNYHFTHSQEDFGLHRCQIMANGLLTAWKKGENSPEARWNEILQNFSMHKVDLKHPYLNFGSQDIYSSFTSFKGNVDE
jgi:hypothetical protein